MSQAERDVVDSQPISGITEPVLITRPGWLAPALHLAGVAVPHACITDQTARGSGVPGTEAAPPAAGRGRRGIDGERRSAQIPRQAAS